MDGEDENAWVKALTWRERWEIVENLPGGGQGEAFKARRLHDGKIAFLKTIRKKQDSERRARFFREASAYESFEIEGIPALLESNSILHKEAAVEPYIATEFIDGPTLRRWREVNINVDLETAVAVTIQLLEILSKCHARACVHRDVKPDNIILAGSEPKALRLLDFGLSYHELPDAGFETETGQEVGNRFLRLPELSAGSIDKQDPRSDVSFAGGILFFLLTGEHPDVLQDARGRLPHQRSSLLAKLQSVAGSKFPKLAALFDNAFTPLLSGRFSDAQAMRRALENINSNTDDERSAEADFAAIMEVVNNDAERRLAESNLRVKDALSKVQSIFSKVNSEFGNKFNLTQTNFNVQGSAGSNTLFWSRLTSSEYVLATTYEVRETGDELVLRMSSDVVFRTPLDAPDYGDSFQQAVRTWLLARLRDAITNPDAFPPEADNFRFVRPLSSLTEAKTAAAESARKIIAFVFDPSQPERSKLQYALANFLQNRRTQDMMNAAFVIALVPLWQVSNISDILNDKSMEEARWIVFDEELNPLAQDTIYANAKEGERIMNELTSQFGTQVPRA